MYTVKNVFPSHYFYLFFPNFFSLSDTQVGLRLLISHLGPKTWVITSVLPCHPLRRHKWWLPNKKHLLDCSVPYPCQKKKCLLKRTANSFSKPFPLKTPPPSPPHFLWPEKGGSPGLPIPWRRNWVTDRIIQIGMFGKMGTNLIHSRLFSYPVLSFKSTHCHPWSLRKQ